MELILISMSNTDTYLSIGLKTSRIVLFENRAERGYEVYQNVRKNEVLEKMLNDFLDENNVKEYSEKSDEHIRIPISMLTFAEKFKDIADIDNSDVTDEEKLYIKQIKELEDYIDERDKLKDFIFAFLQGYKLTACDKQTYDNCQYKLSKLHESNRFFN